MSEIDLNKIATEAPSRHHDLDKKSVLELLQGINEEDKTVPYAVEKSIPQIETLINEAVKRMEKGGRLFYIGAGTSGRLGIVDASECPPTYGVPHDMVIGLIAGGDSAIRIAVENAEDDPDESWKDLSAYEPTTNDIVVGIAASGRTPYVVGGIKKANEHGLLTGCIVCTNDSPAAAAAQYPIEVLVGPEYVTGSTRMKSGTAQKLVLNMISTTLMIRLGKVKGNKMIDMQLSNAKLVERGTRMIMNEIDVDYSTAKSMLLKHGSVRNAIDQFK